MPTEQDIKVLQKWLSDLSERIKKEQKDRGIRASGFSADSLRYQVQGSKGTLYGEDYFEYQEFGLPPLGEGLGINAYPSIQDLVSWIRVKPVPIQGDEQDAAERIQQSIYSRGTRAFQNSNFGLPLNRIFQEEIRKLAPQFEQARIAAIAQRFDARYND